MADIGTDAGAGTDAMIGLAKDVGELKGLVSAQTNAMTDLSARFDQLSAKVDKMAYPVWAMAPAFVGAALAFVWQTLGLPLPWLGTGACQRLHLKVPPRHSGA